ncbi:MAG TPA: N-6 DNA methylase [Nitrososphaera sp.]|nr:N-6 DNA methylase [Nitrososphaera sp.]
MSYLSDGISKGLISLNENQSRIKYIHQNKTYNYNDPEEKVRADSFLQLALVYGYPARRIDLEVNVPRRTPNDWADLVVYNDDAHSSPYIVVECKRPDVRDEEFRQAIEQGFGNTNSLKAAFLWVTSGTLNNYYNVKDFGGREREKNIIADIPHFGKTEPAKAKFHKGGVTEDGEKAFDIAPVAPSELTRRFKQAHDALWAGGKRNPSQAFDELDKLIFCKIWDEKKARKRGEPYDFQVFTVEETSESLLERIRGLYEEGRKRDPEVFQDDIRLTLSELTTVVGYLAPIHIENTDLDSKGRAFETFLKDYFRGDAGQFFTPRPVVEFVTEVLPITNDRFVLDPACGSSGFLLYALNKVRSQANDYYNEESEPVRHRNFWHEFAENRLYGIEISEQIARTAKMNMIIHDDGHTNVIALDGLEPIEKIRRHARANNSKGYRNFERNKFDVIATNPPFGSIVKAREKGYIGDYDLGKKNFDWIEARLANISLDEKRDSQKSEILFIEQCHKFLKSGGFLAIVVPDGIFTNSSLQYVRDWIEEHFRIVAVVSLPQTAFQATGAGVKSSVLFLRKYEEQETVAIRALRQRIQDELFAEDQFSGELRRLIDDKSNALRKGDVIIQELNEFLVTNISALREQGTLDRATQRHLERETKDKITAHKLTDEYKEWKQAITDEYNEKIEAVKEALQEEYLEKVRARLSSYPIFMAIAETIGYDATGRETRINELVPIADELKRFIQAVSEGKDDFFV